MDINHVIAVIKEAIETTSNQPHNLDGAAIIGTGAELERTLASIEKGDLDMAYVRLNNAIDRAVEMDDLSVHEALEGIEDELFELSA